MELPAASELLALGKVRGCDLSFPLLASTSTLRVMLSKDVSFRPLGLLFSGMDEGGGAPHFSVCCLKCSFCDRELGGWDMLTCISWRDPGALDWDLEGERTVCSWLHLPEPPLLSWLGGYCGSWETISFLIVSLLLVDFLFSSIRFSLFVVCP